MLADRYFRKVFLAVLCLRHFFKRHFNEQYEGHSEFRPGILLGIKCFSFQAEVRSHGSHIRSSSFEY